MRAIHINTTGQQILASGRGGGGGGRGGRGHEGRGLIHLGVMQVVGSSHTATLEFGWAWGGSGGVVCGGSGGGTGRRRTRFIEPMTRMGASAFGLLGGGTAEQLAFAGLVVGVGDGVVRSMGSVRIDFEEEEADESHARGAKGEQQQEVARVAGEQERAEEREEEGAEPESGERKSRGGAAMMRPVEGGSLDGRGEGHAAAEAGEVGEEAEQSNRARGLVVGLVQGKIADGEQSGASKHSGPRAATVDEHADGEAHGVHAQVPKEADQVALSGGELEPLGELGSPCRVDVLCMASQSVTHPRGTEQGAR